MFGGVKVQAIGVPLEEGAGFGGQIGFVFFVDHVPNAEELYHVIVRRSVGAVHGGEGAPRGEGNLLDELKIIFRVGVGEAERGIRVSDTENVGDAPFISQNTHIVLLAQWEEGAQVRGRPGIEDERNEGEEEERKREEKGAESETRSCGHKEDFIIGKGHSLSFFEHIFPKYVFSTAKRNPLDAQVILVPHRPTKKACFRTPFMILFSELSIGCELFVNSQ